LDKAGIIAEIIANSGPPIRRQGDFTWDEFADEWEKERGDRMTRHRAENVLNAEVRAGRLAKEKRYDPATFRVRKVWWAIDK
jgi:hypothetical protein